MEEGKLIKECLSGNAQAQKQLYDQYAARMLGLCYRYVQNREEAEDVLQDGFIKAFLNLKRYKGDGPFEAWLRRIMVNTALNHIKSRNRFEGALQEKEELTEQDFQWDLSAAEIVEEIRQLPYGYRTVFNLYAVEGYSHKEIGVMLGISEGTSRSQYARARNLMMKKISSQISRR